MVGQIEQVIAGGENYDGSRPLKYEWVRQLYQECAAADVRFCFIETGTNFEKDGKVYHLPDKSLQSRMAYKSGLQHPGKEIKFKLQRPEGKSLFDEPIVYHKKFRERCSSCGSRLICNSCSDCGMCDRRRA